MRLERSLDVTLLKHRVYIYIYLSLSLIFVCPLGMKSSRPGVMMALDICVDLGREALCFSSQAEIQGLGVGNIPSVLGA